MKRFCSLACAVGLLAARPFAQAGPSAPSHLTVVSEREASEASGRPAQRKEYIQRDRRREDSDGFGGVTAFITRCDLDRRIGLSMNRREYSMARLSDGRRGDPIPGPALPDQPTLAVKITTLDTGERMERFGYVARRVIMTRRETPLPGSSSLGAEVRSDGWYVDLAPPRGCPGMFDQPPLRDQLLSANAMGFPVDRVVEQVTGARETGFAIEEHRTYRYQVVDPGGGRSARVSSWSMRVLELSSAPHDPALFEIPRGFALRILSRRPSRSGPNS